MMATKRLTAIFDPLSVTGIEFEAEPWSRAQTIEIGHEWQGSQAPRELATGARILWNREGLSIGYQCRYTELDIDEKFDPAEERHALWDRDVCEAFIRSPLEPHAKSYREFEVAPTGQWCDLLIDRSRMWHDWQWRSGMATFSKIDSDAGIWHVAMVIPWEAFGCCPEPGDIWHANLFRISRLGGERRYLTFSPTYTGIPSFHVAEAFVELEFSA